MLKDVLYIDDSLLDLFIVNHFQQKYHCFNSLTATPDAISALAELELNADNPDSLPDVIFLDLYMPYFNGFQFLDEFEKLYPLFGKEILVHILTSSVNKSDITRCKRYPQVKDYHIKPFTIDIIFKEDGLH